MKIKRRKFMAAIGMSSALVAGTTTILATINGRDAMCRRFGALAKLNGSVLVMGLSRDEQRSLFDGKTCVNSFRSGVVFYDGPENDYTRPTLFVGPNGESMPEPVGFAKDWHYHAVGEHFCDPIWEAKFQHLAKG